MNDLFRPNGAAVLDAERIGGPSAATKKPIAQAGSEPEPDFFAPGSPDLVIVHQPAIAVYTNNYDAIVIRAEPHDVHDDDVVITVRKGDAPALAQRLMELARE